MSIWLNLIVAGILAGCSSSHKVTDQKFGSSVLQQLGVTQRPESPLFPFEEFYKTSGLSDFDFSPDGKTVFFLKSDGKVRNIFKYDLNSKMISQITKYPETVNAFKVGPKGRYLYIQKDVGGSEVFDLYRFDLSNSSTKQLTFGKNIERSYLCDINKSESKLYFSQSRNTRAVYDLQEMDLKSFKVSVLVPAEEKQLYCDTLNSDGTKLLFQSFINNNERHVGYIDTKNRKTHYFLAEPGVSVGNMHFVGDSVFLSSTKGSDVFRIWKYEIADDRLGLVDIGRNNDIQSVSMFSNGKVTVLNYRGLLVPETKIFDGPFKTEKVLNLPGELATATFSNHDSTLGVVVIENAHTPSQYFLSQNGALTKFYDSNQSTIDGKYFSKSYSTFVESYDGLKVPVHFIVPNGTSTSKKRPAIVWVHGGPESHVDPIYSSMQQYLTNNGFVLIAPNVRGSTGFGKAYQFKDNGDWGGGHVKDLVAVANYAKTLDFIDKENIFVIGGSFGGFSVMSLVTQYPTVFKAAVNIFGPIEMAKFIDSWPPLAQAYWLSELGGDPRKDESLNKKISPFFHIEKIKIPIQVHQGSTDIRVPQAQSDLLVGKMKELNIAVDYHVYPDEGHGFLKFENTKKCFTSVVDFYKSKM